MCPCVGAGLVRGQNARVPRSRAKLRALRLRRRAAQNQSPATVAEVHAGLGEELSNFKDILRLIQFQSAICTWSKKGPLGVSAMPTLIS